MRRNSPTATPKAEHAREFEDNEEFSPSPSPSQSPAPTPMSPIRMVSLPATQCSVDPCMAGEDAVFHTPPEYQADSSLEDQNPNDLCAEKVTISEAKTESVVAGEEFDGNTVPLGETEEIDETGGDGGVGFDGDTVPLGETEEVDETEGDGGVGFDGDTVPLGETEEVDETEGDGGVGGTRVLSDEGIGGEDSVSCEIIGYKSCEIESGEFEEGIEIAESAERTARACRKRKSSPSCKAKEKDAEGSCEIVGETHSGGLEKSIEMSKSVEKSAKDVHGNGGVRGNCKRFKGKEKEAGDSCEIMGSKRCETESGGLEKGVEMAKSAEKGVEDGHGNGGRKRKLPPSCTGKEKDAGASLEKQSGLTPLIKENGNDVGGSSKKKNGVAEFSEFLDLLMKHFDYKRNDDEDDEDDDFIATAKKRGMNFPTPKIWKWL